MTSESAIGEAQRGAITFALILATVLSTVASTIANVVLPQIRASTGAAQDEISWVLTSFILAGAVVTPALGWLEQKFGRRVLLLTSIIGFTIAGMLCGLATGIVELVVFRLLQGAFGAVFIPMSQAILLDINPPQRHGQAMALWGIGAVLGPIIGPVLGGWLAENLTWRWVFFINVPLATVAFFMVAASLPKHQEGELHKFDAFGFIALALGLIGLQLMLDRGPRQEWFASSEIWIEFGLGVLGFYLFFVHTFTAKRAIFDRSIWKDRNFLTAGVMIFFIGMLMFAGMAVLPTLLQSLLGYPVLHSGVVQLPRGVGTLASMVIVGRLIGRVDSRLVVLTGLALTGWSYAEMSRFALQMDETLVLLSGLMQGLGLGLIFVPMSALAFTTVAPPLRTQAASLFTLIRNVGSSIGISFVGALQIYNTKIVQSQLVEHVTPDNQIAAASIDFGNMRALAALMQGIARQAAMVAYVDAFHLLFWMCVALAPLVLVMRTKRIAA